MTVGGVWWGGVPAPLERRWKGVCVHRSTYDGHCRKDRIVLLMRTRPAFEVFS